ncbi:C39 family peptidase [Nocardioides coralli]|uniref:C39 family peptidase n=1 Tax=Nocardioides coralli TaxID=2872154 RepID=UPI001CA442BF|nr:C39 family peptidase [Nocardioides coralli]QZY28930.1 C39 family peptidase [Nocardioides coralli]
MSRTPSFLPSYAELRGRDRAALAAAAALVLIVTGALFVPAGDDPGDGLAPTTAREYVALDSAPGRGVLTPEAEAEIDRVLATAPARLSARVAPTALARDLVRCAEFEDQQYCLGVGWTEVTPQQAAGRALARPTRPGGETTGDLATADLLAQRAALPTAERIAVERAELEEAARSVAKVVLLRHQLLGEPLPEGFLERHPEARASASTPTSPRKKNKLIKDYPQRSKILNSRQMREQHTTYWCGPTTMQAIAWGWQGRKRTQRHWARQLGTTTSGTAISDIVRLVNRDTGYDRKKYAGTYIVLDISDWNFHRWLLLQMRHIHDYRAPVVLHPMLLKKYYPYLDDDASGHFQVGRGYDKRGDKPPHIGYFEPWNQQRFDPSEPYIRRVQWRDAYKSYRANRAHPHQNIGV